MLPPKIKTVLDVSGDSRVIRREHFVGLGLGGLQKSVLGKDWGMWRDIDPVLLPLFASVHNLLFPAFPFFLLESCPCGCFGLLLDSSLFLILFS